VSLRLKSRKFLLRFGTSTTSPRLHCASIYPDGAVNLLAEHSALLRVLNDFVARPDMSPPRISYLLGLSAADALDLDGAAHVLGASLDHAAALLGGRISRFQLRDLQGMRRWRTKGRYRSRAA
jgi:hypothetical protein